MPSGNATPQLLPWQLQRKPAYTTGSLVEVCGRESALGLGGSPTHPTELGACPGGSMGSGLQDPTECAWLTVGLSRQHSCPRHTHPHVPVHVHVHTYMRTHIHTHTPKCTHVHTNRHPCAHRLTPARLCASTLLHAHVPPHMYSHTPACPHTYIYVHVCTPHTCTHHHSSPGAGSSQPHTSALSQDISPHATGMWSFLCPP